MKPKNNIALLIIAIISVGLLMCGIYGILIENQYQTRVEDARTSTETVNRKTEAAVSFEETFGSTGFSKIVIRPDFDDLPTDSFTDFARYLRIVLVVVGAGGLLASTILFITSLRKRNVTNKVYETKK